MKQCPSCTPLCLMEVNCSPHSEFLHWNRTLFFADFGVSGWGDQKSALRLRTSFGGTGTLWKALQGLFFLLKTNFAVMGLGGVTTILGSWSFWVPGRSFLMGQLNKTSCGFKHKSLNKNLWIYEHIYQMAYLSVLVIFSLFLPSCKEVAWQPGIFPPIISAVSVQEVSFESLSTLGRTGRSIKSERVNDKY